MLGCGHCKKAKPEFMDAAKHDAENNKVGMMLFVLLKGFLFVIKNVQIERKGRKGKNN